MIKLPIFQIKEASRAYAVVAEMEKKAFNLNIDPGAVLGSLAGGYAATSYYKKNKDKQRQHKKS